MIKAIVFDLDGTLVDSIPMLTNLAVEALQRYGVSETWARRRYQETLGHPFRKQLGMIFPGHPYNDHTADWYADQHAELAAAFPVSPGISKEYLRGLGKMTGVISSTWHTIVLDKMPQLKLLEINYVTGQSGLQSKKLQLGYFIATFKFYPQEVLFVGDTNYDAQVAREVGTRFLRVESHTLVDRLDARLLASV